MKSLEIDLFIKRDNVYKNSCTPREGEKLSTEREQENLTGKEVICVKKDNEIVGYLLFRGAY